MRANGEGSLVNGGAPVRHSPFAIRLRSVLVRCGTLLTQLLIIGTTAVAQPPTDTLLLKEFEVSAPRLATFGAGSKVQRMDSTTMARYASADLGELLANESPVFIKSYGLGAWPPPRSVAVARIIRRCCGTASASPAR